MAKAIKVHDVKKLREQTGAGIMDAKNALQEAEGNVKQAIAILQEKGIAKAGKKMERATGAGIIDTYVHDEGRIGVMLEVGCETDFVARNKLFKELVHNLALHIASEDPQDVEELLKQPFLRDQSMTVQELISQKISVLGENIQVRRFVRYISGN